MADPCGEAAYGMQMRSILELIRCRGAALTGSKALLVYYTCALRHRLRAPEIVLERSAGRALP